MIPLRDNIPSRTVPFVNYGVIALCAFVFFQQLGETHGEPSLVERYGMVPARITRPAAVIETEERTPVRTPFGIQVLVRSRPMAESAVPPLLTLITCVFLHGGWMHFIGNMWFLWIFGDNVEDRYGHLGYLIFYLASGLAASIAHFAIDPSSTIPTIGASGAIAGVMGAYLLLYPRAKVLTLVPIIIIFQIVVLPAPLFLGIWFVMQFFQGVASITVTESTGVAWWAHIGGFAAGFFVSYWLGQHRKLRPRVESIRPGTDHVLYYQVSPWHRH